MTAIADGQGGVIPLPDNFYYVGGTKSEGIVISDNSADAKKGTSHEVAKTLQGNQFVWVPVENETNFIRYDGYTEGQLQSDYMEENMSVLNFFNTCEEPCSGGYANEETEYNQMKTSVLKYDGFYVGRYEAGTTADSGTGTRGDLVVKQGANVYNNIKWGNSMTDETGGAVEVAQSMYSKDDGDSVTSTLIYGVQWDAIMTWIDSAYKTGSCTENSFVRDSTGKGIYSYSGDVLKTGANGEYSVKNIYDLAGNVWEWTMESCSSNIRILRGRQLR